MSALTNPGRLGPLNGTWNAPPATPVRRVQGSTRSLRTGRAQMRPDCSHGSRVKARCWGTGDKPQRQNSNGFGEVDVPEPPPRFCTLKRCEMTRVRAGLPSPNFTQLTENAIGAAMARRLAGRGKGDRRPLQILDHRHPKHRRPQPHRVGHARTTLSPASRLKCWALGSFRWAIPQVSNSYRSLMGRTWRRRRRCCQTETGTRPVVRASPTGRRVPGSRRLRVG